MNAGTVAIDIGNRNEAINAMRTTVEKELRNMTFAQQITSGSAFPEVTSGVWLAG